jgi:hypothetical protein
MMDVAEEEETLDQLGLLPEQGIDFGTGRNRSTTSVNTKGKADKMLGLSPDGHLCSMYMVSGTPKVRRGSRSG